MNSIVRRAGTWAFAAALSTVAVTAAAAQDGPVTASSGWVRLPAEGATSTMAFAAVSNPGMYAIYLLTATSDVAKTVALRDARKGTQPVEVPVLQYETTYMDPKGAYLLLSDLKRPLKEGETIWIVLKTDAGETVNLEATVRRE